MDSQLSEILLMTIARRGNGELARRSSMKIGKIIRHPKGYRVKVIDGCFLDPVYGRVSNWWTWRKVLPGGKLGRPVSGYGW